MSDNEAMMVIYIPLSLVFCFCILNERLIEDDDDDTIEDNSTNRRSKTIDREKIIESIIIKKVASNVPLEESSRRIMNFDVLRKSVLQRTTLNSERSLHNSLPEQRVVINRQRTTGHSKSFDESSLKKKRNDYSEKKLSSSSPNLRSSVTHGIAVRARQGHVYNSFYAALRKSKISVTFTDDFDHEERSDEDDDVENSNDLEKTKSSLPPRPKIRRYKSNILARKLSRSFRCETEPTECNICLMNFEVGESIGWSRNPDCKHGFHKECIVDWLTVKNECPICRRDYLFRDKDEESFDERSTHTNESCITS